MDFVAAQVAPRRGLSSSTLPSPPCLPRVQRCLRLLSLFVGFVDRLALKIQSVNLIDGGGCASHIYKPQPLVFVDF